MRHARNQLTNDERAFTLIELLIALTIASLLTAIALPTLKDSMRQNTLSRCASLVKGAFVNARAQAIRSGRPFGIVIERRRNELGSGTADNLDFLGANYSTRLYYVQSPVEYRGDSIDAVAFPVFDDPGTAGPPFLPRFFFPQKSAGVLAAAARGNPAASRLISVGTKFSLGNTGYVFEIESATYVNSYTSTATNFQINEPGTIVDFNYRSLAPAASNLPGDIETTIDRARFPAGLETFTTYPFRFRTNPIRAALAPVTTIGKTVVDLSVSGTAAEPLLFNAQAILDVDPANQIPALAADVPMGDVVVMFAPDGRMDGIYVSQRDPSVAATGTITSFFPVRVDPASTVSFNVGFVDGILDNIDDAARYPYAVPGTNEQANPNDPQLEQRPMWPAPIEPKKVPNFANTDCAWISIHPLSGAVSLGSVASQPPLAKLNSYYGFASAANSQTARNVVRARLHQSRRLTSAGTIQ